MNEFSHNLEVEMLRALNDHTAVVERIYDSMRATGELISAINDRQDRFEMKMDRMEVRMDIIELRMMNIETIVDEIQTQVASIEVRMDSTEKAAISIGKRVSIIEEDARYIRSAMVTRKEFNTLDGSVRVLENKIA